MKIKDICEMPELDNPNQKNYSGDSSFARGWNTAILKIAELEVKFTLDETELRNLCKIYFGYKNIDVPAYSLTYGDFVEFLVSHADEIIKKGE